MREGEIDYKGKFWIGQRVRIHNLPTPEDILCDTGVIIRITTKFQRTPDLQTISYEVRIDGSKGMFKTKIMGRVYQYGSSGDNLEVIDGDPQEGK